MSGCSKEKNEQSNEETTTSSQAEKSDDKKSKVAFYVNSRPVYKNHIKNKTIDNAIIDEIIYEKAFIDGMDKQQEIVDKVEFYKKNLLIGRVKSNIVKQTITESNITDEQVKKYYKDNISNYTDLDLKQLIFQDEATAQQAYQQLNSKYLVNDIIQNFKNENINILTNNIKNSKKYNKLFESLEVGKFTTPQKSAGTYSVYIIENIHTKKLKNIKRIVKFKLLQTLKEDAITSYANKVKGEHNIEVKMANQ